MENAGDATGVNMGKTYKVELHERLGLSEQATPSIPPELQKANELIQKLVTHATNMVLDLATCECEKINECEIAKQAREIAKVLKEFQKLRVEGLGSGESRREA